MTFWSKVTLSTARPLDRFFWSEIVLSDVRENIHFLEMKTPVSNVIQNKKTLLASFRKIADFIFIPLRYLRFSVLFRNPGWSFWLLKNMTDPWGK